MSRSALAAILIIPGAGLLIAAGCGRGSAPARTPNEPAVVTSATPQPAVAHADYVGSEACEECHKQAYALHRVSRHNLSLFPGDRESLGKLAPPVGRIPGTPYSIAAEGDRLTFGLAGSRQFRQPLDIAFGSGKTGITFASFIKSEDAASPGQEGLLRVRLSWFPHLNRWFTTPKDEDLRPIDPPHALLGQHGRNCLGCHVVKLDDSSIVPEKRFYGVGCESCHGPGSAHIAAARTPGASDMRIERLGSWSSDRLVALCDRCHGSVEPVNRAPGKQVSVRIAQLRPSVGLRDSLCFQKSGGRISCLTCHSAHSDVRAEAGHYEAVCMSCHRSGVATGRTTAAPAGPAQTGVSTGEAEARWKPCPVQPSGGCLACHMPSRRVFVGGENPTRMTDHCIRRFRPKEGVPGLTADMPANG
jgi:hypothetical protein